MQLIRPLIRFAAAIMMISLGSLLGQSETVLPPQAIVDRYCSLDAKGALFSSSNPNFNAISALLINEDEAGYDSAIVIKSYRIGKVNTTKDSADVEVIYSDLGVKAGEEFRKEAKSESVMFHLTKVGANWKINGLRILPHISKEWLLSEMSKGLKPDQLNASKPISELRHW